MNLDWIRAVNGNGTKYLDSDPIKFFLTRLLVVTFIGYEEKKEKKDLH